MFQHYWLEENYKHHEYTFQSRTYEVDEAGFLTSFDSWDEGYALFRGFEAKMPGCLTPSHWEVLKAARALYKDSGREPDPESLAEHVSFDADELDLLFVDGWQRGVLRLAGIPQRQSLRRYTTDVMGFLVEFSNWTEGFATMKARDLKMDLPLRERHWEIISYLQRKYRRGKAIPNIYTVCKRCNTNLEELEQLFPDGYHRGAVKLAGLRAL
jgi:tRNA 2-thiouridine synthesizing protein E